MVLLKATMIHLITIIIVFVTKQRINLKLACYCRWETDLYCSCSNDLFYMKTLRIGSKHDLGSCILDVLLSGKDYF